jgi:CubicO group peptidase (beta-lactamase class C family)
MPSIDKSLRCNGLAFGASAAWCARTSQAGTTVCRIDEQTDTGVATMRMDTRATVRAVAAIVLAVGCSNSTEPSAPGDTGNQHGLVFAAFDSAMEAGLTAKGLAGATAVIVQKDSGIVYVKGYGAYDKNRIFLLASASKVLSVGVLMRLADQGALNVDAPIGTYVGSQWGSAKSGLTIAQMLSNSSGMVGLVDNPFYLPYLCQYRPMGTSTECAQQIYSAHDANDIVPPDTQFRYGGGQWQLAGGVAVAVSGKPWSQLIRETYVEPCGTTSLGYTNQFNDGAASGYPTWFTGDPSTLNKTDNPNIEGGGYISAEDYGKILLMHLRGGMCGSTRVLSEAAAARMQQDRIGSVYGGVTNKALLQGYGLGWWIDRSHPGVVADIGLYGATPWIDVPRGYAAMILIEGNSTIGGQLWMQTKPILDAIFDAAHF